MISALTRDLVTISWCSTRLPFRMTRSKVKSVFAQHDLRRQGSSSSVGVVFPLLDCFIIAIFFIQQTFAGSFEVDRCAVEFMPRVLIDRDRWIIEAHFHRRAISNRALDHDLIPDSKISGMSTRLISRLSIVFIRARARSYIIHSFSTFQKLKHCPSLATEQLRVLAIGDRNRRIIARSHPRTSHHHLILAADDEGDFGCEGEVPERARRCLLRCRSCAFLFRFRF